MSLTRKIFTGIWTGTVASVLENLLRIPRMMVVTRVLGPELYGILGIFGVFRELVGKLIQLGTGDAVIQFTAKNKALNQPKKMAATIRAAGFIRLVSLSIVTIFVFLLEDSIVEFILRYPVAKHLNETELVWLLRLLLLGITIQCLEGPFGNALQGIQAWHSLLIIRIIAAFVSTIFPVVAAILGCKLLGIVIAQQLAFAIVGIVVIWFYLKKVHVLFKKVRSKFELKYAKKVLLFGLPLIFSQILRLVYSYTDQLMLAGLTQGPEDLSYYEVARNTALTLAFIPTLLRSVMFPAAAEFYSDRNKRRLEALFHFMVKHLFWMLLPLAVWMSIFSTQIIKIVSGEKYLMAAAPLSWLAIMAIMRAFGVPFFTCLVGALGRTKDQFIISAAGGALNVGLNAFLIPEYGVMGAVYATALGYGLSFSLGCFFLSKYMKLLFPKKALGISIFAVICTSCIVLFLEVINEWLVLIALLPLYFVYFMISIKMGILDKQDVAYIEKLIKPLKMSNDCILKFLNRYSATTPENLRI